MSARPRVSRRIARALAAILIAVGLAHLVVAGLIIGPRRAEMRERLLLVELRLLRPAAVAGLLTPERLVQELGDFPEYAVALFDRGGRLLAQSRQDAEVPVVLSPEQLRDLESRPQEALVARGSSAIAVQAGPDPVRYVGIFDRWSFRFVNDILVKGLIGGFIVSLAVGVVAQILLSRRVVAGLRRAAQVVRRMADGDLDVRLPPSGDDEIGQLAQDFNAMADRLAKQMDHLRHEQELRRRSFADWTHELATPLSSVLGYLETLRAGDLDAETVRRYVATAHDQAMALKTLSDDLALLSQLDFDGLALDRTRLDLRDVARAELEALRPRADEAKVTLALDLPPDETSVLADRQRLGQVVRNLLTNAIRHTPAGGRVSVRIAPTGDPMLEVADEGPGVPAEHLAHLGELFYRADPSRDRRTGGRGLGLAISRGIVTAHGGTLELESEAGQGTVARVRLPAMPT